MTASTDTELFNGPRPIAHGWRADTDTAEVDEVWVFGAAGGTFVQINARGRLLGSGPGPTLRGPWDSLAATRREAVEAALAAADERLTQARAAVDSLRAELARDD